MTCLDSEKMPKNGLAILAYLRGPGFYAVIPAQAGIQAFRCLFRWIPACAGMTSVGLKNSPIPHFFNLKIYCCALTLNREKATGASYP